jgi:hypothetical protein
MALVSRVMLPRKVFKTPFLLGSDLSEELPSL